MKKTLTKRILSFTLACFVSVGTFLAAPAPSVLAATHTTKNISSNVERYDSVIRKYTKQYGISQYTDLIKAIMMQESNGQGGDPMECTYGMTNYGKGKITDPEKSIRCGVKDIAYLIDKFDVSGLNDMNHIASVLQSYNYGGAFSNWIIKNYDGIYSEAAARAYPKVVLGRTRYGDPQYVAHVLRYYVSTYEITYNLNGGKNSSKNPSSYVYTSHSIELSDPTREGYTFAGWYADEDFTRKVKKVRCGDKTLYAKWKKN